MLLEKDVASDELPQMPPPPQTHPDLSKIFDEE
jgi:hypothetical protein